MAFIAIPVEVVHDYRGKPIRTAKRDTDWEAVYKKIHCPECSFTSTNLEAFQDHLSDQHDGLPDANFSLRPEMEDMNTATLLLQVVTSLNVGSANKDHPLASIRKTNDSFHAGEVWRRAWPVREKVGAEIRLKKDQYDWVQQVLTRELKGGDREDPKETVAMHLFTLSEDNVRQALTTLPERRQEEADPDDKEAASPESREEPEGKRKKR